MHFSQPHWFIMVALVTLGLPSLYVLAEKKRRAALARFALRPLAALTGGVSVWRRHLKSALVVLAIASLAFALARPLWGSRSEERTSRGIDLIFAIDTSKSMLAQDAHPDRLTRAKMAVSDLVAHFSGNRVGLIAFAGRAFLACPLTLDHQAFDESLTTLDTASIARGGTNIASAIQTSLAAFGGERSAEKLLVLLTDGENLEQDALSAAKDAAAAGLRVFTVGVGSSQGELIPITGGFLRDASGNYVKSRLDEQLLTQIAAATGGSYAALGQDGKGLDQLYSQHLASLPTSTLGTRVVTVYTERFEWPLALAFICLLLETLIGERRRRLTWRPVAAAASVLLFAGIAHAAEDAEHVYNAGVASYRGNDFKGAAEAFKAALSSRDLRVQEKSYYDLGNSDYRQGQATKDKDRDATISTWTQAIADYDAAIALDANDEDAVFNRDFVKKQLDALEQQKPPPQKDDKDKDKGEQKDGGGQPQNEKQTPSDQGAAGESGDGKQEAQAEPEQQAPSPGKMSAAEAKALLDSLRGDDHHVTPAIGQYGARPREEDTPKKDW